MSNLRGEIRTYARTVAGAETFTINQLLKHLGVRTTDEEGRKRVLAAINGVRMDGVIDPDAEIVLKTIERGHAWRWANAPGGPVIHSEPAEPDGDPGEPVQAPHVCAFEVVGRTTGDRPVIILRNSIGEIFKAIPID
jgi:hypothetical protein